MAPKSPLSILNTNIERVTAYYSECSKYGKWGLSNKIYHISVVIVISTISLTRMKLKFLACIAKYHNSNF